MFLSCGSIENEKRNSKSGKSQLPSKGHRGILLDKVKVGSQVEVRASRHRHAIGLTCYDELKRRRLGKKVKNVVLLVRK